LLVRDGGVPGVVIRLGRAFSQISIEEQTMTAAAGALAINVARTAQRNGFTGL